MMQLGSPGVYIVEAPATVRPVTAVATSIAAFVDCFTEGPTDRAVQIFSTTDFQRVFGPLDPQSEASYAINQFFLNGGASAWVVRASGTGTGDSTKDAATAAQSLVNDRDQGGNPLFLAEGANPGDWSSGVRFSVTPNADYVNADDEKRTFNVAVTRYDAQPPNRPIGVENFLSLKGKPAGDARFYANVINDGSSFLILRPPSKTDLAIPAGVPIANGTFGGQPTLTSLSSTITLTVQITRPNGTSAPRQVVLAVGTPLPPLPKLRGLLQEGIQKAPSGGDATPAVTGTRVGNPWQGGRSWAFRDGSKLAFTLDGVANPAAAKAVATITGKPTTRALSAADAHGLKDNDTILYRVGGATEPMRTLTFHGAPAADFLDITAATIPELRNVLSRDLVGLRVAATGNVIRLTTDKAGSGAYLEFTGGTALTALGLTVEVVPVTAGSNVADLDHVTEAELKTLVEAQAPGQVVFSVDGSGCPVLACSLPPGPTRSLQIVAAADDEKHGAEALGWDTGLHTSGNAGPSDFDEDYKAITVDLVGGRFYVRASRQAKGYDPLEYITIAGSGPDAAALGFTTGTVNVQEYVLGARKTVRALAPAGSGGVAGTNGVLPDAQKIVEQLALLDKVDLFNMLLIPRMAECPDSGQSFIVAQALAYCQKRRAMLFVDIPRSVNTPQRMQDWLDDHDGFRDPNSVIYFPRVQVPDPANDLRLRSIGASGTLAGVYARTDAERGVWKAPAGVDAQLRGVVQLDYTMTDAENGVLNPLAINCLRLFPVYGEVSWGARTLDGADVKASQWKYVPVRRLALMIEESLFRGTKWVVFEPNDEPLWAKIRQNINAFMLNLFRQGAFQGGTPDKAYFVKCDGETTTANDRNLGIVNILVGFAPLKPAEFVVITIQQIPDIG